MKTRLWLPVSLALALLQCGPIVCGQGIQALTTNEYVGDVANMDYTAPAVACGDIVKDCCRCGCYGFRVFGDYLYLRARDAEVPYAVQANSAVGVPVQTSRIAVLDPDFSSGIRAGFGFCLDECSELALSYTYYDVGTPDSITKTMDRHQILSMVAHPNTEAADFGTVCADGHLQLNFQRADLDYRRYFLRKECTDVNWLIGACYGQLRQNFQSRLTDDLTSSVNDATWDTAINFYGAGLRFGLEAEQYAPRVNMVFYAKGISTLLAGEFDASYLQQTTSAVRAVDTSWKAGRIVPTFDLEVGGGFYGPGGKFRATLGYVFSAWTNVVKTQDWVRAVQTNDFTDMSGTMTLDGLVTRIEGRF